MNRIAALALSAGMITMAACSDSPTAPTRNVFVPKSNFVVAAVGDKTTSTPEKTLVKVCKDATSDANGNFNIEDVDDGTGGSGGPTLADVNNVAPGDCYIAAIDLGDAEKSIGDWFHVTEDDVAGVTETEVSCIEVDAGSIPCDKFFVNTAHGVTVTWKNVKNVVVGCTYTKGWYQNKNGSKTIIAGILGLTIDQQYQIFSATPGKPGNVKWGVTGGSLNNKPNDALNLYQQLLAALNNLKGNATGGPDAVDKAISDATAAITVNGTTFTVAAGTDIGGLTGTLSSFNEGKLDRPHCGDEVLVQ
jgi:hypothetical protein